MKKLYISEFLFFISLLFSASAAFGQNKYKLITSTSDLVAGEKYIIASAQSGTAQTMSYQNTNNRPQASSSSTVTSSVITLTPASVSTDQTSSYEITLGGSTGAWTLYDAVNTGYLYAASSSSNFLRTHSSPATTWTITFSTNAAILTDVSSGVSRNILQYNSTSSLFSCYSGGQSSIYLYRKTYAVIYNGNGNTGGAVPTDNTNYFSGSTVTVLGNTGSLTKSGYTFNGWNTASDGSGTHYNAAATFTINANTTLYAEWVSAGVPEINITGNNNSITDGDATPSITDFTDFSSVCIGSSFTRTYTIENTGGVALSVGAITIDGAQSSEFVVTTAPSSSVAASGSTTFIVTFTPTAAGTRSAAIHIVNGDADENPYDFSIQGTGVASVTPSVSISSSDADNIICAGTNVTFTPTPTNGGASPAYNWWKNGIGTGTNLGPGSTFSTSTLANGDAIACVMTSNASCASPTTANSNSLSTTVNALPATPSDPTAAANPACTSTTLNTMTPTGGETWYWQGTTNNGTSTAQNTSTTYAVSATNTYYVRAQNNSSLCWSAASGSVSVTVNTTPSISVQPSNQTVSSPTTATFTITASNAGGYQWEINTGSGWTTISGATSSSYTTGATTTAMSGYQYRCVVSGNSPCSSVTSNAATLTVNAGPCISANFDGSTSLPAGWSGTNSNDASNLHYSSGPNCRGLASGGDLISPATDNPISISFYVDASGSGGQQGTLEYRIGAGSWITIGTFNATLAGAVQNFSLTSSPDLSSTSNVSFRISSAANTIYIDDFSVYCSSCSSPAQASALGTNSPTTDGFSMSWTAGSGNGTMVVVRPTSSGNTTPASGSTYTANLAWGSAGQIDANNRVVFRGAGSSAGPVTGLTAETQYTITAYEYNSTGNCYTTASAPTTTRYTLSTEPTAQPTSGLSSTTCNTNSIDVTVPAPTNGADGYLVIYKSGGGSSTGLPTDGQAYAAGNTFGDATVGAVVTSASTVTISGLSASTSYTFKLVPYNANAAAAAQTYNYLTSGTLLQTTFSTPATSASTSSLVSTDISYGYTTNIDYAAYQSASVPSLSSQSVGVFNFIIYDGDGSTNDADGLPTLLNGISFTYTGTANTIRAAALFTTTNSKVADANTVGANSISFTGLTGANVTTNDNNSGGAKQLILRVTFGSTVTDNDKLVFSVSSVTSGNSCSYSQFNGASGGGATSDNSGTDKNRIEVFGKVSKFTQQPSNTANGAAMSDVKTVAIDNNKNIDLDWAVAVSVACSTPAALTGNPVTGTISGGITTFSGMVHTIDGTYTMTASASGLRDTVSDAYTISTVSYGSNAFLSTSGSGSYNSASSWCKCTSGTGCNGLTPGSGGWGSLGANGVPTSASTVYIQGTITEGTAVGATNATILSGGDLVLNANYPVSNSILVKSGGKLHVNDGCVFTPGVSATFTVEDNGSVYLNKDFSSPSSQVWNGIEDFYPQSNFYINNWDVREYFVDGDAVTVNSHNGYSAMFGNIFIDPGQDPTTSNGLYNLGIARQNWDMLGPNNTSPVYLMHGNFEFVKTPYNTNLDEYKNIRIMGNPNSNTYEINIHGNIKLDNTWVGSLWGATKGNFTLNVDGNIDIAGGSFAVRASQSATGNTTLNLTGNLSLSGTSTFFLNQNQYNAPNATFRKSIFNLKGNLTVASTAFVLSGCPYKESEFNFVASTPQITQLVNVASAFGGTSSTYKPIPIAVKDGAYVQLSTNNLQINDSTSFTVESGGTLDFGFSGTTALYITQPSSPLGSNSFNSLQGSILKITSPDGLYDEWDRAAYTAAGVTVNTGNVQGISKSNRNISPIATFWYTGKANQKTGDAPNVSLSTNADAKIVICDLADNTLSLTPTVSFGVTATTTLSPTGGKLDIRKGQFTETETAYIFGNDGTLYMSPGTLYKILKGNSNVTSSYGDLIPRMSGSGSSGANPYILTGGTIELAGTGSSHAFQTIRSTTNRPIYHNLKFSGANTYLTDYKNLSDLVTVDDSLYITGNAVVDCINNNGAASFVGSGGLVMDGGRIRLKNVSSTQPEMTGDNVPYILSAGTVEFYGTSSTQQQQMRANYKTVSPVKISYYDVDINANAANYDTTLGTGGSNAGNVDMNSSFLLKHNLVVYSPAVFRMDETDIINDAASPSNSFTVSSGAGLLYGSLNGIKSSGTGTNDGNIRISGSRFLSPSASYGFVGPNDMVSGTGLPTTVANLYVYKSNRQKLITLSNNINTTGTLNFYRGIVTTNGNTLTVSNGSKTAITGYDPPYTASSGVPTYIDDRYVIGNLERSINSTGIYVYPVGDAVSGEAYNPLRFNVSSGTGNATAQFIPGDPGIITVGPVFFDCSGNQKGYLYTDMTTEGKWRMTSSTGTTFNYNIFLHPNIKNQNTVPNLYIDSTGTNYYNDYRALKAPNGTTDWSAYANIGDLCVSSYYYNIEGDGFSGFSDFAPAGGNTNTFSQLPVELVSFTGSCNEDGSTKLNWATASEQNSMEFIVEQSLNGTTFNTVANIAAAGNSNSLRNYTASVIAASGRTYYRLKMVDLDGSSSISNTILVNCGTVPDHFDIYFTAEEGIVIHSQLNEAGKYDVGLYDVTGKLMLNESRSFEKGSGKQSLDIRKKIADGIYFIRLSRNNESFSQKLWIH